MQPCRISTTVPLQKEIFHLRTTGHVIQGVRHRAAALSNCRTTEDSSTGPHHSSGAVTRPEPSGWVGSRHPLWVVCPGSDPVYGWQDIEFMSSGSHASVVCVSCSPWERTEAAHLLFQAIDRIGQTHFSVPGPDTYKCKKQAIKATFCPLSNFRNSLLHISNFICLTHSLVPSETCL